jgi:PelA/Pel-15E family pectate lyase
MRLFKIALTAAVFSVLACVSVSAAAPPWKNCLRQPPVWYASPEAVRIAGGVLAYQFPSGGWDKNLDNAAPLDSAARARLEAEKKAAARDPRKNDPSTIDNGATCAQLRYLARVCQATRQDRFKQGFLKGFGLLLKMQYPNGGWPQYAFRQGYHTHITFNDNAMINVMRLLREAARAEGDFAFLAPEAQLRGQAQSAVSKGVECILKCQVRQNGRPAAWCAQHDEKTLAPAPARKYELPSLSGAESVEIVRFLMSIENPSPEVKAAIEGAAAWFQSVRITGLREAWQDAPGTPRGKDKVMVADAKAGPLWARFYELGTNRPFFCGRDSVKKYTMAEIEYERRTGYAWYVSSAAPLLEKDYPAWQAKWVK